MGRGTGYWRQSEKSEVWSTVRNKNRVLGLRMSVGTWQIGAGGDMESQVLVQGARGSNEA